MIQISHHIYAHQQLLIHTDGASRGNPGPAGIGVVICDESGKIVKEYKDFIGTATNNIAEYRALIKALELASSFSRKRNRLLFGQRING